MRDVQVVAEQHLQRMFAGFQRNFGHSAAIAEMNMVLIFGNWQSEIRNARVDEEVVVSGVRVRPDRPERRSFLRYRIRC